MYKKDVAYVVRWQPVFILPLYMHFRGLDLLNLCWEYGYISSLKVHTQKLSPEHFHYFPPYSKGDCLKSEGQPASF